MACLGKSWVGARPISHGIHLRNQPTALLIRSMRAFLDLSIPPYFPFCLASAWSRFICSLSPMRNAVSVVTMPQILSLVTPLDVELRLTFLAAKSKRSVFTSQIGELSTAITPASTENVETVEKYRSLFPYRDSSGNFAKSETFVTVDFG